MATSVGDDRVSSSVLPNGLPPAIFDFGLNPVSFAQKADDYGNETENLNLSCRTSASRSVNG